MSDEILFLHSPLKEKIYGGTKIQKTFGFDEAANQKIGEYWAISAHENGTSIISNGTYKNHSLKEVYKQHRELFHNAKEERFPLLIKINEITRPVSVQVHPDDIYAEKYENDLGKAEFCLYLDVDDGTKLIRGHTTNTKEESYMVWKEKCFLPRFSKVAMSHTVSMIMIIPNRMVHHGSCIWKKHWMLSAFRTKNRK